MRRLAHADERGGDGRLVVQPGQRDLSLLLRASEAAGTVRPGLDPDDVLLMMGFLWRIDPQSDWRTWSGRLPDLLIDGLRAGAPEMAGAAGAAGDPPFPGKR